MTLYFPGQKETGKLKTHYLKLKERTALVLEKLQGVSIDEQKINIIDAYLLQATKPEQFWGPSGKEARSIVNFEDICIALNQHVPKDPKRMTVLEFFRTLETVKKKTKHAERGQKK